MYPWLELQLTDTGLEYIPESITLSFQKAPSALFNYHSLCQQLANLIHKNRISHKRIQKSWEDIQDTQNLEERQFSFSSVEKQK